MTFPRQAVGIGPAKELTEKSIRLFSVHKDETWRRHIDGLRALPVLAVVFYHTNFIKLPGGYVGLDAFFVISGLLISGVIHDDIAAHRKFKIARLYERRPRRILPAFAVVTAATVVAGYFLFLTDKFSKLARSVMYACGFTANIFST